MINRIYRQPMIENKPIIQRNQNSQEKSFHKILDNKICENKLNFSAHANNRLQQRGIELSEKDIDKLNDAVNKVEQQGARESLIVMNDVSFIVNIKNKTVITALDDQSSKNNVFTNIDSAILLEGRT